MDEYTYDENVTGGNPLQTMLTAPITIPLLLVALILIIVATTKLSSGEYASGFSLFLVGGVMAYFAKMMMG